MTRAQIVGFGFIAAVAVVIALWLALAPLEPTTSGAATAPTAPTPPTASTTQATTASPSAAAAATAGAREPSSAPAPPPQRATRAAQATVLKKRLELLGRALDAARQEAPEPAPAPSSSGTLTRDEVQQGVQAVKPQIVDCYEQALAQNPKLNGNLKVLFEIGEDPEDPQRGAVIAGEVDSEIGSPFFEACVLQSIVGAPFPRPTGGVVRVTYPFGFAAREDDAAGDGDGDGQPRDR